MAHEPKPIAPRPIAIRLRGLRLWQQMLLFAGLAVSVTSATMLWLVGHRVHEAALLQAGQQLQRAARAVDLLAESRFERRRGALLEWVTTWTADRGSVPAFPGAGRPGGEAFALVLAPDGGITTVSGRSPNVSSRSLAAAWPVTGALRGNAGRGLWNLDGRLFEVFALPLPSSARHGAAAAVLGDEVRDVVDQIRAVTGAEVLLLAGDRLVEGTLPRELVPAALARVQAAATSPGPAVVELGGQQYLMGLHDVATNLGEGLCRHVILQPLGEVLAPSRRALRDILLLSIAALGLTLLAAGAGAHSLSRPLARLTTAVAGMAEQGSVRPGFPACGGGYEVAVLEGTFRRLAESLTRAETARETSYREAVAAVVTALDARDHGTYGHSLRVASYARLLGERVGLPPEELCGLEWGALLHDVGKIAVPDTILQKAGPLEPVEWEVMRRHTEWGRSIVCRVAFLRRALPVVESHHERWDGAGYPVGLEGAAIPIAARIFAVVDAYDAMTTLRPYQAPRSHEQALAELERVAGTQLDPALVTAFGTLDRRALEQVRREHDDMEEAVA